MWVYICVQCMYRQGGDPEPLICAADINVGKLAGAVASCIRTDGVCQMESIGPTASHKALKGHGFLPYMHTYMCI